MKTKVALVTGGGTGIGRSTSILLAQKGFHVFVNYSKSAKDADETCQEIIRMGGNANSIQANIGSDDSVKKMVSATIEKHGRLDVLVNNAGTTHFISHTELEKLTDKVWEDIFGVNVLGTFYACRAAIPELKKQKGNIVNVTSVAGLQGSGSSIPYAMSKGALNTMTKSLAKAFAPEVRVNAVAPGPVLTRWLAPHPDMVDSAMPQTPLKKASGPDDIAKAIAFLASEDNMMTGQILVVDGGRTM